jgi:RNA-directed DNA polymerase
MSGQEGKPFAIPKELVWQAWRQVKANGGAAGADGVTIEMFEKDLKDNLYRVWNRMSSGTYFPPPVRAVEIPKASGGTRMLGVPSVGDRVAQTVAAMALEPRTEAIFHDDSYGYRPRKGALDAVAVCRQRCWEKSWVIDLDIRKFFDSVPWDLAVKAVQANVTHEQRWITLYVRRWLAAPIVMPDGRTEARDKGTPQGSLCSAEHNDPYAQCWVMRSAGLPGLVDAGSAGGRCALRVGLVRGRRASPAGWGPGSIRAGRW